MSSKLFRLEMNELLEFQMNRFPYLLIDVAEEVSPGKYARGYKNLSVNEWFFNSHFPGDPNMPGMLQIEALIQMSALAILCLPGNKGKIMYISKASNLHFKKKVLPGSVFCIETEVLRWRRGIADCKGVGMVNGEKACSGEFRLVLAGEMIYPNTESNVD